jgi:16S rRNA (cytidine1402-2'-O)-methyltransferase
MAALSGSGLPTDEFTFAGFLPSKAGKRREKLTGLKAERRLLVFYEAPHRLASTLVDMSEILGNREAVVARELTKIYEEFGRGLLSELAQRYSDIPARGEVVVLVAPGETEEEQPADMEGMLKALLGKGMTVKDAVRKVAETAHQHRSTVYDLALELKGKGGT